MIDLSPLPYVQTTVSNIHRFITDELEPMQRDLAEHLTIRKGIFSTLLSGSLPQPEENPRRQESAISALSMIGSCAV